MVCFVKWHGEWLNGMGNVAAVTAAGVVVGASGGEVPARVLPDHAAAVPMESELRQGAGDGGRLLLPELNPNPLAYLVSHPPELRGFGLKQCQNLLCG